MPYILIYLFLEVMVSSYFVSILGGFTTFIFILLSAFIGITLLRNFKYSLSQNIKDLTGGNITQEEFVKTNMAKALGAMLLIVPGFFTDILGILLQFGILTMLFTKIFKLKQTNNFNTHTSTQYSSNNFYYENTNIKNDDEIIDVEIIEKIEDKDK